MKTAQMATRDLPTAREMRRASIRKRSRDPVQVPVAVTQKYLNLNPKRRR